jgi:periplasmic protein TonB
MQTDQILSAPLLDIIFEGRNKDYGAYELRATYHRRIRKALLVTGTITVLVFSGVVLANSLPKDEARYKIGPEVTIQDLADEKPPEKLPEPERQRDPEPPVQTVDYTEPVITENPETPPPTQDQIAVSLVDTVTRSGVIDDGRPNLNGEVPVNNSAPAGRYSVVIRFVVDVDGSTSEITALTAHGYGLEQEAIRVIKKSKKWEPAFLNGVHVKAYKKQVIVFEVVDE